MRRPRVSEQRWRGNHREFCVLSILSRWVPEVLGLQQQLMPCKAPLALGLECSQKNMGNLLLSRDELVRHPLVFILSTILSRDEEGV